MDLGLSVEEYFASTPRKLDAMAKRHQRQLEDREFLFAQLTASVVNYSMARPKDGVRISDFMPSELRKRQQLASTDANRLRRRRRAVIATETRLTLEHFARTQ